MFNISKGLSQRIKKLKTMLVLKIRRNIIEIEDKLLYNLKCRTLVEKKPE